MRLTADFLMCIGQLQSRAANDNRYGDRGFIVRNLATTELTYTLAMFRRDDGVP